MPSSDLPFTLSVLVPVLFIVVVEITGIARNVDLIANIQTDSPNRHTAERAINNFITYLPKFQRGQQIPAFGHFGTLHAVNVTILIYGVWIVNYGLDGAGRFILSMAVLIILALLPVLEVDEYREIRRKGVDPISHKIHGVGTFFFGALAGGLGEAYAAGIPLWLIMLFGMIFVLAPIAVVGAYFSVYLERELYKTVPGR